jgi:hypothetical protein
MEINWNSVEDLKCLRSKIDRRLNQLIVVEKKEKKNHLSVFESCQRIYQTDLSHLYEQSTTDRKFYVYLHCDPFFGLNASLNGKIAFAASLGINYLPFYVGKGEGKRAYDLNRNDSHRKKRQYIERSGKSIQISIIKEGLTESEALILESKLIDIFGLTSFGGWLVNLDEGTNNTQRKQIYYDDYVNINKMLKNVLQ